MSAPTPAPGAMPPFDLRGELPRGASTLVLEASAGTGKTWTIASLVARYVAEGVCALDRMLIITFTRAASRELRERVRERLVVAERALEASLAGEQPDGDDALLDLLTRGDVATREDRRRRLAEALVDFDAATIATTHTFCQLVLRSLGVAGDTDPGATLVEDLDTVREEAVDDLYLQAFADPSRPTAWTVGTVLPFDRRTAGDIAVAAVGDPCAELHPTDAPSGSTPWLRARFAHAVRREMQVRKRRLGVLSYDDLLSRLADALLDPGSPARARMRARWQVVLVDEFQDTDPVQWDVLDRAFSGHATMVLIGDPKQAIYAFRGGDVHTYLRARATATDRRTLATNHRSDAPLLERVVTFLGGAELGEGIVVHDVEAAHRTSRVAGLPQPDHFRLRLLDRARFGPAAAKGVPMGEVRREVAADLAADVAAVLASAATYCGRPLQARDVAVLCARRADLDVVQRALARVGVHAVIAGSGDVVASRAGDEWLALLEAMERPDHAGRVRAAGLTSFFGLAPEQLVEGGERLTVELSETLRDWADLMARRGVAAVLEIATAGGALTRRVLDVQDGERLLTDLRHLAEMLHDRATRDRLGLPAVLGWLREQRAEVNEEKSDEQTRRLDSDAAAVQLLTIHGSKGLQFPVVYLPFVASYFKNADPFPRFHDDAGRRCRDVGGDPDPGVRLEADGELAEEQMRLLYVAVTRAQSHLVTWWFPNGTNTPRAAFHRLLMGRRPGDTGVPKQQVALPSDDAALERAREWEAVGGPTVAPVAVLDSLAPPAGRSTPTLATRRWSRSIDHAWRRTSYTALSAAAEDQKVASFGSEPEATPKQDEPAVAVPVAAPAPGGVRSPMADLPVGATFGSLVHAVLEHTDPAAPDHGGDLRAALLEQIAVQRVRWPVELDPDVLANALVAVCDTPLGPLVGDATLREIGVKDRMAELDFELPLAGGDIGGRGRSRLADLAPLLRRHLPPGDPLLPYADVLADPAYAEQVLAGYLTGSVDVVLRAGGRFVVVDYKSNWLGGADEELTSHHYRPEALAEAMTHSSYPLQALLYAVVLHRFLRWRLPGYDPERHVGGVMYLYLRGMCGPPTPGSGVFSWQPPVALVEAVSALLAGDAQ